MTLSRPQRSALFSLHIARSEQRHFDRPVLDSLVEIGFLSIDTDGYKLSDAGREWAREHFDRVLEKMIEEAEA